MTAPQTPSQTVGPYFSMILARDDDGGRMAGPDTPGEHIRITGRLFDGAGDPIEDGLLEVWQANAAGRYRHPLDDREAMPLHDGFTGFGRVKTNVADGTFQLHTVRPGRVPAPDGGLQAPHISVIVQGRGMLNPAWTRLYFADEEAANRTDPVLTSVSRERRATLVATRTDDGAQPTFHLDIRMQGDGETVFLDW
ncbi:MAG TPA: protocatechuate 3,4-dioxygenase subunit alpha [Euzebya sp.]|nr:protocatechuate 3,4-dioxygenase subunit alpha [Euzebya sp.]